MDCMQGELQWTSSRAAHCKQQLLAMGHRQSAGGLLDKWEGTLISVTGQCECFDVCCPINHLFPCSIPIPVCNPHHCAHPDCSL